ncbi:DUF58 domain-containing protein [Natronosalvus rutilus]|uniref:DUF58 domain-containing protein n=1 Tax=Natronosalvus rutilus TaxID=2953753 RepID=A0A9E7NA13_9EURY|nr:DUF58 domain-containing protein [Natronosalvus rutilus]UTF53030.1 DUF58 domain-containing protein [Natronosalvus rutilus]
MSDASTLELEVDEPRGQESDASGPETDSVSVGDSASDSAERSAPELGEAATETDGESATRTTGTVADERPISSDRWTVALGIALVAVGVGVVARDAAVFLSSVVALTYAVYGYATTPPSLQLVVKRRFEPSNPVPGESVSVTVTVANDGTDAAPDVCVADQPPTDLALDGTPRAVGSLAPGESLTFEYAVNPRRGTHVFDDVVVESRNVSGSERLRRRYEFEGEGEDEDEDEGQDQDQDDGNGTRLTWNDALERLPLAGQTIQHPGRVETDVGGEGLEFHSLRPFQPSDPMRRVDWKRLARTGELTTIEFREERATSVVVVVDARDASAVVRNSGELDGRSLSIRATEWLATTLLAENNRVGVALYGGRGDYLLPRTGRDQLARVRRLLDGEWCGSFGRPSWLAHGDQSIDRFCRHLADEKQVVFVTPLLDDDPVASVRRFRAYGHEVTVVCPGVADRPDLAGALERLEVDRRRSTLRSHGVRVVEWRPDESLHVAVDRSKRRWST